MVLNNYIIIKDYRRNVKDFFLFRFNKNEKQNT